MRRLLVAAALALVLLTGCSEADPAGSPTSSPSPADTDDAGSQAQDSTSVDPPPAPRVGQCHRLTWDKALAPALGSPSVKCRRTHTSQTYAVGRLDLASGDERLAVDDPQVQGKPAEMCPRRLPTHLGISARELRLTMARPVWFTPTLEEADAGANWFRCDVVVLATAERLLRLPPRTKGAGGSDDFAMCATAQPGTPGFERVACRGKHSWRAVATVDLPGGRTLPSVTSMTARMSGPCRDVARSRAADPLEFTWSEEVPTRPQWRAGQRYGICWVPD